MIEFGIVGVGWRAAFFARIALACPERFRLVGAVARRSEAGAAFARAFGVATFDSIGALLAKERPQFVVTSVSWEANPKAIGELVERGMPVLSETPPAEFVEEMEALYALVRRGAKIQVAEQYFLQPLHAARLAFAHSGKIGQARHAQVSVAHGYHGISLMRKFLQVDFESAVVTAHAFRQPKIDEGGRGGPPEEESLVEAEHTIAYMNFGDKVGVFDFADGQYWSATRSPRVLVRGERGEIVNETASYLTGPANPARIAFERQEAGQGGNLEGQFLKGIQAGEQWLYRNPFAPARLFDDEIAIADCLQRMGDYVSGGPAFYSLAQACQDRYLDLLIDRSIELGGPVASEPRAWVER